MLQYGEDWTFKIKDQYGTEQGEVTGKEDGTVDLTVSGITTSIDLGSVEMMGLMLWKHAQAVKKKNGG